MRKNVESKKMTILNNDLYHIVNVENEDGNTIFTIGLNADSRIYAAHFPGNPITPGVCLIQTGLELTEQMVRKSLEVAEVKNVKFTNILSPSKHNEVEYVFKLVEAYEEGWKVRVDVREGNTVFTSISMTCK